MKLILERDALNAALGRVAKIVDRKATIPILAFLRLDATEGSLAIAGTDLDIEASTFVAAEISEPGVAAVSAQILTDIVGKMPAGGQIAFESKDEAQIIVRGGRSRFALNTLPAADFPEFAALKETHSFALDAAQFAAELGSVAFAISTEETRYYLNGVYMHAHAGEAGLALRLVATDGHRMGRLEITAPQGSEGLPGMIIPAKTVGEIRRLGKDAQGPVEIMVDPRRIRLTFLHKGVHTILTSKLIDGTFPDYQRVIPAANDKSAKIDRAAIEAALGRVECVKTERSHAVKFTLADDRMILTASNADVGEAVEEIDAAYDGAPIDIGFNAKYFADALGAIGASEILIKLADPGTPALLMELEGGALQIVVMPMRI